MTLLTRPDGPEIDLAISRRTLGLAALGFAGYAPAALAQNAQPIRTDEAGLVASTVTYPAPDGFQLPAYVARPQGNGPFPVVVVASEIFGLHDYIRDVCRRLAKAGYAAIAPAFFVRVEDTAPLTDFGRIREIVAKAGHEQVMGDIAATLAWADGQVWARGDRVGITGFCWGGKVTWQACARFAALDAGVAWYGQLAPRAQMTPEQRAAGEPWPVDLADDLKCPVLGLYGEADQGIPLDTVSAMQAALQRAGQTASRIDVYAAAPHGFHADYRDSHRPADAADGWSKLIRLFGERLS